MMCLGRELTEERAVALGGIIAIVLLVVAMAWLLVYEERQWQAFAEKHRCTKVGEIAPDVNVGVAVSPNGQVSTVTTTTAGKIGYKCDDGVTYWR